MTTFWLYAIANVASEPNENTSIDLEGCGNNLLEPAQCLAAVGRSDTFTHGVNKVKTHLYSTSQALSQPPVVAKESSTKPVVTPRPAEDTAPMIIVTETQPLPTLPVQAQMPTTGSSIADLSALVLVLTVFFAVIIASTKR
jgi:hypothetical protein